MRVRRVLSAAALAAAFTAVGFASGPAALAADCNGTVNYCPDAGSCDGDVNYCQGADTCNGIVNYCSGRVTVLT